MQIMQLNQLLVRYSNTLPHREAKDETLFHMKIQDSTHTNIKAKQAQLHNGSPGNPNAHRDLDILLKLRH
jgi:hypothetical protein